MCFVVFLRCSLFFLVVPSVGAGPILGTQILGELQGGLRGLQDLGDLQDLQDLEVTEGLHTEGWAGPHRQLSYLPFDASADAPLPQLMEATA